MTTSTNLQFSPYLLEQWKFPTTDVKALSTQIDVAYVDIAYKVNLRTIGVFPNKFSVATGERWYLAGSNQGQQTLRQVYQFSSTGSIVHGLNVSTINYFTKPQGSFTDGTNWYGAIYASNVAIAGQVSFYITSTNIVIIAGAGAPVITSGIIVLEWLSQF